MIVLLNRKRLESPLVNVPGAGGMTMGVPALRVGEGKPADEPRQVAVLAGPDDQMPMVGHHAMGEQAHARSLDRLLKDAFERFEVGVLVKERHAAAGSVESMIDIAAVGGAKWSGHAAMIKAHDTAEKGPDPNAVQLSRK